MFETVGILLVLVAAVVLAARHVHRILTGAKKGCRDCPGCTLPMESKEAEPPGGCPPTGEDPGRN